MEKVLIPDELLPKKHQGKGYRIREEDGKVFGVRGHALTLHTFSPNGFNHPILLDRNVWWLRAKMFLPNPDNHSKVIEEDGKVRWLSDDEYEELVHKYNPRLKAGIAKGYAGLWKEITDKYLDGATQTELSEEYGCCRKTVYNILKRRGIL